jgi:hypothetical protein
LVFVEGEANLHQLLMLTSLSVESLLLNKFIKHDKLEHHRSEFDHRCCSRHMHPEKEKDFIPDRRYQDQIVQLPASSQTLKLGAVTFSAVPQE